MGFDRLHPSVQHHVVNSLGWRELRPLQSAAIAPILDGEHCLLLAPTAGGKTEAAVFPVLSRMLSENWDGLSVLYVCPIRALLNNLEERLSFYGSLVGRRCGLWHGDVGQAARSAILRDPPDLLLTTPESVEAILLSRRTDRGYFFGNVRAVMIDEIHSFAADDRGWHLLAVLERIALLAGRPPQRIGLSATAGNPEEILGWMTRGQGRSQVVAPTGGGRLDADVKLDYAGSIENAALIVSQLNKGEKRLVFTDSRAQAERLASLLRGAGTHTFVSHSSLSVDERRQAERAFRESRDCVIVATSTLELGIDVGDLDRVLQLEAPGTVASFLQRIGRSGRRSGTRRNCLFLATQRQSLLAAAALLHLWKQGYVEGLIPPPEPLPVAAQQILAHIRQNGGVTRPFDSGAIQRALPVGPADLDALVDHMLAEGILFEDGNILGIGPAGERAYGAKNFMSLMSVFDTPPLFQVVCGIEELGWVHPLSFHGFGQRTVAISLGGRAWDVTHLDETKSIAYVRPSELPGRSLWLSGSRALSRRFCGAIREVLLGSDEDELWSRRARAEIAAARAESNQVRHDGLVVEGQAGEPRRRWWTFAGLKGNYSLALRLRSADGSVPRFDNFHVEILEAENAAGVERRLRQAMADAGMPPFSAESPGRVKFWDCLPPRTRQRFSIARFCDPEAASGALAQGRIHVDRCDGPTEEHRRGNSVS